MHLNIPFTLNTDLNWRNFHRAVTQQLCWWSKQVKDFILQFVINGSFCWGTQNYLNVLYKYWFFPSGGGVDGVLVSLSLIKQIIKDVSLMYIPFSFKHPQTFGNREWVCPICPELFPKCIHAHLTHNWW